MSTTVFYLTLLRGDNKTDSALIRKSHHQFKKWILLYFDLFKRDDIDI